MRSNPLALALLLSSVGVAGMAAQQRAAAPTGGCRFQLQHVGGIGKQLVVGVDTNYYANGGVQLMCADSSARIAIAGLSQITPLRLRYLDRVWQLYQQQYGEEMPVDVWNMHVFVLREEAGNWGVDIPPGFADVQHGELWEIEDHNNLQLIEAQIRRMRQWMVEHGQHEKQLWITEYGILMPPSYGFPPSVVNQFIEDSFDLFNRLTDPALGDSADDQRLIQRWTWFSAHDQLYPTPNLFNGRGRANPALRAMMRYLETHQ